VSAIPLDVEEANLRAALRGAPDSPLLVERLCAVLTAQGKPIPLELEERSLTLLLVNHSDRADLLQRLCTVLGQLGKPVPLELEERTLAAWLKIYPDRSDLRDRLEQVEILLGKKERQPTVSNDGVEASHTDIDFQTLTAKYAEDAGTADMDERFLPIFERCRQFTMTSVERMYALYKAVEYVLAAQIPGAFVECGVWRGGSMMVAAETLRAFERTDRDLYLFDTFEGLPRPDSDRDVDIFSNRAIDGWQQYARGEEASNWAYASLEDVRANLLSTQYPSGAIHYIKGMVERTVPDNAPESIAILRLDTDWYVSTKHELVHLFPRLQPGGVLIIDDYGHFLGARRAVDEFLLENGITLLLNRIDYSGRLAIKT
jgi:O-methyltransferase